MEVARHVSAAVTEARRTVPRYRRTPDSTCVALSVRRPSSFLERTASSPPHRSKRPSECSPKAASPAESTLATSIKTSSSAVSSPSSRPEFQMNTPNSRCHRQSVCATFFGFGCLPEGKGRKRSLKSATTMCNQSELESPGVVSFGNFDAGFSHQFIISPTTPLHLIPSVTRHIFGRTARDAEIDQLPAPATPLTVYVAVLMLRWYRKMRPASIGQRCVWDPSCSRYAELAIRKRGMFRGLVATVSRLVRCRPAQGGIDLP